MSVSNIWGMNMAPAPSLNRLRHSCESPCSKSNNSNSSSFHWGFTLHKSSLHRHRKELNPSCRCSGKNGNTVSDWDWNRWSRHFSEIEQTESLASVLKFQLEDAIEKEEFQDAAKLKMAIEEATSKDSVAEIMAELKNAIEEERYHDALRLCKNTGSGLVGWWVGCSKDSDDPFGRLVRVTPGVGKFVGQSYTPRQLVTAAHGTPIFEIYVIKDADGTYNMKVVYLQRAKATSPAKSAILVSKATKGLSTSQTEDPSVLNSETEDPAVSTSQTEDPLVSPSQAEDQSAEDIQVNKHKTEKSEENGLNIEGATEEGIKSVLKFLKDKIPGLKVKVMNIDVTDEAIEDSDSVKQLMQENDDKQGSVEKSDDEASNLDEDQHDTVASEGDTDTLDDGKNSDTGLFIGGVLHREDAPTKDDYVRLPAEVKDIEKDSFVLHIPGRSHDKETEGSKVSKLNAATVAAQVISELMPSDVAKTFWSADKISSKVARDVREIVKLAVSQAQKRKELFDYTNFSRVTTSGGDLDPFDGLYVGAFGPYGTEVVQLRRKFGSWNGSDDTESSSGVEFFEYVEAIKLTGDLNVPAGQVTFRAKIGKGNRTSNRGLYPDELGVVSSYRGQGRIAEFGFQNPRWVEGELLQLSGRGMGPYVRGADLGFLYIVPEQSFLVLFNRLKLPK